MAKVRQQQEEEVAEAEATPAETVDEAAFEAKVPPQEEVPGEQEGEEEAVDEVAVLQQEVQEAKALGAEYLDGWQRARAELANARKRFQREQEQAYANARAGMLVRLLPIVDDFERAFGILTDDLSNSPWIEGVKLIQQKLVALLDQEGVVAIEVAGHEFDPYLHQAVTHEPSEEVPEGHIIAEMQKGYRVGDRVLRPSIVRVSAGPPAEPEEEVEPDFEEETGLEEQS